ncbi:heme ABC transporter ATP-binding protein [Methanomethylovorans sp.]|uniref:heme ABC transporter ATP-binding protein n=1 Tax=Methanomethylovorans sp. TaxID=2758717 RepID=UPI00345EC1E5
MLEIKDISVSYGSRKILNKVNLTAREGEIIGIVGPNGSGKTTFLKSIVKYLKPDAGSISINGTNINDMDSRQIAKNVAVVSQIVSIGFDFTVRDIVLMGRTPYINGAEKPEDIKIAEDAMKKTNTYEFKDRMVTQLSGGELQRVIIARALAQTPKILLLDEPTSHLDIAHQVEIFDLVREAANSGLTVIAVIHDLNLAAHYCDRICMLKAGEIVRTGQPRSVFTEENIQHIFNIPVEVNTLKTNDSLYIMPLLRTFPRAG